MFETGLLQQADGRWLIRLDGRDDAIYRKYATAALVLGDMLVGSALGDQATMVGVDGFWTQRLLP